MLRAEPALNPQIARCFRVPDACADSFLATHANAESARLYGARVWTYHEVVRLLVEEGDQVRRGDLMLQLDTVDAAYGGFQALFGVSMRVNAGEAVAASFSAGRPRCRGSTYGIASW